MVLEKEEELRSELISKVLLNRSLVFTKFDYSPKEMDFLAIAAQ
jgi:hypothetical protein